jgi:hypothetical protein
MKKFSKVVVVLFFPLAAVIGYYFYPYNFTKQVHLGQEVNFTRQDWQHSQSIIKQVQSYWDYPDRLKNIDWAQSECPWWDFKNFHEPTDLRQNFLVFRCLLAGKVKKNDQVSLTNKITDFAFTNTDGISQNYYLKKFHPETDFFEHMIKSNLLPNEYLPFEGIKLIIAKNEEENFSLAFTLSYDQKIKYLPQASYYYGQDINQLPIALRQGAASNQQFAQVKPWDNVGRFILIDKQPVRNFEFFLWSKSSEIKNSIAASLLKPEEAVSYLTRFNQELYCQSRGMQLLDAAIFDAATFYRDIRDYKDEKARSLFYFGNRWPLKNKCQLQTTLNCVKEKISQNKSEMQISWMGLLSISDNFESLANNFDPVFNLRAGSKYFKENSAWQYLANRLTWDGVGFAQENFKWVSSITGSKLESIPIESNLPIQFRCMKEWISYP